MIAKNMHVFGNDEKAKLVNTLKDFYVKKQEYLECFMARVPLEIAADYRNIIPSEMFCNLIMDRLNNCYYRSQEVSKRTSFKLILIKLNIVRVSFSTSNCYPISI